MSDLNVSDAIALMDREDGDGFGFGGGLWFWWIIIVFLFFIVSYRLNADRDSNSSIAANTQATYNTACQTQREILESRYAQSMCCCETQKEILENRYANAMQFANNNNVVHLENEATRALITNNRIRDLETENSNLKQSQYLLAVLGKWRANPPCPCNAGCDYNYTVLTGTTF
jgi:hypothetical protein